MKILILGIDGYIGWPLALHLLKKGYEVAGLDNYSRRTRVIDIGSDSLTPISEDRIDILKSHINYIEDSGGFSLVQNNCLNSFLKEIKPDTIIHLAEQPSAPYSMRGNFEASVTQYENVIGTLNLLWAMKEHCPEAHLIKLGSMGEYGTPDCDIPEGEIPLDCITNNGGEYTGECDMAGLQFPKSPNSFYHLSKVFDSQNIKFACDTWGLCSTDIMQGIVFGLNQTRNKSLLTRFDYDQYFGTVINRFCVQAISKIPLTIYGTGGQIRSFLPLRDSIKCIELAVKNPPKNSGEYRVFNQYSRTFSMNTLAYLIKGIATEYHINCEIKNIFPNPRTERSKHKYNTDNKKLLKLGYRPTIDYREEIRQLFENILPYKDKVIKEVIMPTTTWK